MIRKNFRLAVLGGGNMGTALVSGLVSAKTLSPSQIIVTDLDDRRRKDLQKKWGVRVGSDNLAAVRASTATMVCVKPQQMAEVLTGLKGGISSRHTLLSIAAGVTTQSMEQRLGVDVPVVRIMPNTPALVRAGALVYCLGRHAGPTQDRLTRQLLSPLGRVWKASENQMDAVTALSGSGPAYVFYLAEILAESGIKLGLPVELAQGLARQTIHGAGRLLAEGEEPAHVLRQRVTSPGGTTAAALKVLETSGLSQIFQNALQAAARRSKELSTAL